MSKVRGLPESKRMRHDAHFVEEITARRSETVGRVIDMDRIEPNPHQPRKEFGDLSEMVASVKEKGILEPILVRSHEGRYQIIAGERRYQAARLAGLQRVPCIEVDVDTRGMLEISLIEINEGAPLLHDVLAFMKSRNFVSYEILEIHRRPLDRAMNQIDIFFVREGSKLIADRRHYAERSEMYAS